jgi:hypothetical protein
VGIDWYRKSLFGQIAGRIVKRDDGQHFVRAGMGYGQQKKWWEWWAILDIVINRHVVVGVRGWMLVKRRKIG